jgi:hypothetical protein
MNNIRVYLIWKKHISHDYYCQIVAHKICDVSASLENVYFGNAFLKTCQYVISNEKVGSCLQPMNIKSTQISI